MGGGGPLGSLRAAIIVLCTVYAGCSGQRGKQTNEDSQRIASLASSSSPIPRIRRTSSSPVIEPSRSSQSLSLFPSPSFSSLSIVASLSWTRHLVTMTTLHHALAEFNVEQLRALSWHLAVSARGTEHAATLCIDPRLFNKADVRVFLSSTASELATVKIPAKAGWKKIINAWQGTSKEAIATLIASVTAEKKPRGGKKRKASATEQAQAAEEEDTDDDKEDELGASDEEDAAAPRSLDNPTPLAKKTKTSAAGPRPTTQTTANNTVVLCCTGCGQHSTYGKQGRFCNNCGKAWVMGDNTSTTSPSAAAGSTAGAPPSQWSGLATFTPRPAAAVMVPLPARSHDISSLPAQVVEKARSGQHFYTLSDFLPNRAPDASAASSSPLDSNAFILRFNASGEALTTSTADPAEIASIAKRKRQVSSFAEIAEVFFFSLISVIYLGRPDNQEQLVGLLSLANDISRQYGLPTAPTYVDVIRRRHFQSYAPRTHVLLIDTNFDMARLH